MRIRLDIEKLSLLQRADCLINLIEDIDILIVVRGNQRIAVFRRYTHHRSGRKHREVRRFAVIVIDDLLSLEIIDILGEDLLHGAGIGFHCKFLTERHAETVRQPCGDPEIRGKLRRIRSQLGLNILSRSDLRLKPVHMRGIVLVREFDRELLCIGLRADDAHRTGLPVKLQTRDRIGRIRGGCLQRLFRQQRKRAVCMFFALICQIPRQRVLALHADLRLCVLRRSRSPVSLPCRVPAAERGLIQQRRCAENRAQNTGNRFLEHCCHS